MSDKESRGKRKRSSLDYPRESHPSGDVIKAEVGEGAQDVVIGKGIIKIGTLVIPAVPVLIGLLIIIFGGGGAGYYFSLPVKMPTDPNFPYFNVVVADFGQVNADGSVTVSTEGSSLSATAFASLDDEFKSLPSDLRHHFEIKTWHSSLYLKQMRAKIGRVANEDEARQLAQDIGANVVVYGNFISTGGIKSFDPKFYVAPLRLEADEIVGTHDLGSPIDQVSLLLKIELLERLKTFSKFTLGVVYDVQGDNDRALGLFNEMQKSMTASKSSRGIEVINFFVGRENLFLAQDKMASSTQEDKAQVELFLKSAEAAFTTSSNANASYARAHIGLGGVYLFRAQQQDSRERFNKPEWINRALQEYQRSYDLALESKETDTIIKAQLSQGIALFLVGEASQNQEPQDLDQMVATFDKSIRLIESQLSHLEQQSRLLGQAYLALGNAYLDKAIVLGFMKGNDRRAQSTEAYKKALQIYGECIKLKQIPDAVLQKLVVAQCEKVQPQVQNAISSTP